MHSLYGISMYFKSLVHCPPTSQSEHFTMELLKHCMTFALVISNLMTETIPFRNWMHKLPLYLASCVSCVFVKIIFHSLLTKLLYETPKMTFCLLLLLFYSKCYSTANRLVFVHVARLICTTLKCNFVYTATKK